MQLNLSSNHVYVLAIGRPFDCERHFTVRNCEQGVVATTAHVQSRIKARATLTYNDVAGLDFFTAVTLDT